MFGKRSASPADPKPARSKWVDNEGRTFREAMADAHAPRAGDVTVDGVTVRQWVKANKRARIDELAGVHLFADYIVTMPCLLNVGLATNAAPVAGVSASVDNSGGVAARATLARTAVPGAHGWQKKIDTREVWLTVDGPDFQWTVKIPQQLAGQARAFAAAVTTAGRRAAAAG